MSQSARTKPLQTPLGELSAAIVSLEIHAETCGHKRLDPECGYCDDRVTVREAKNALGLLRDERTRIAALESERDSLTAKIDAAPHEPGCRWDRIDALAYRGQLANCTCWKASTGDDALRNVKAQALRDAAAEIHPVRFENKGPDIFYAGVRCSERIVRDRADRIEAGE